MAVSCFCAITQFKQGLFFLSLQMIEDVLAEGPVMASRFSRWFSSNRSPSGSRSSSLRSTPHEELERLACNYFLFNSLHLFFQGCSPCCELALHQHGHFWLMLIFKTRISYCSSCCFFFFFFFPHLDSLSDHCFAFNLLN